MGFGILFIGYLFFFNLLYGGYTDVFGCLFLLYALAMLTRYAPGFRPALRAAIPALAVSAVHFVWQILLAFGLFSATETAIGWFSLAVTLTRFVLIFFILRGVQKIALDTDVKHVFVAAFRNRIFTAIFYGCWFTLAILQGIQVTPEQNSFLSGFSIALLVVGLVVHFFNAKVIFSCYMWICLEGEESMERGQSRNPFVNLVNRFTDKLEDRMLERKQREAEEKARLKAEKDRLHPHKTRKNEKKHK